jgi:hypothetical protein
MAYVSISRAAQEVRIYTDSAVELGEKLARTELEDGSIPVRSVARREEFG